MKRPPQGHADPMVTMWLFGVATTVALGWYYCKLDR